MALGIDLLRREEGALLGQVPGIPSGNWPFGSELGCTGLLSLHGGQGWQTPRPRALFSMQGGPWFSGGGGHSDSLSTVIPCHLLPLPSPPQVS